MFLQRNSDCANVNNLLVLPKFKLNPTLSINNLRGAMGEISNFYNFTPRMFIFGTNIPPIITIREAKFL